MGRKNKYSFQEKVQACEDYISGKYSAKEIALNLKMTKYGNKKVLEWVRMYKQNGPSIFETRERNNHYSKEFKEQVINEYFSKGLSYRDLAVRYAVPSFRTVANWVTMYTKGEQLKDYKPKPEVYMTKSRKTTIEERKEIVEYCLSNNKDYKETASIYKVNYSQVYSWVNKYLNDGDKALEDRRGKRKAEEELSDDEKKNRKILLLERKLERIEKENALLKKLEKLERRR